MANVFFILVKVILLKILKLGISQTIRDTVQPKIILFSVSILMHRNALNYHKQSFYFSSLYLCEYNLRTYSIFFLIYFEEVGKHNFKLRECETVHSSCKYSYSKILMQQSLNNNHAVFKLQEDSMCTHRISFQTSTIYNVLFFM